MQKGTCFGIMISVGRDHGVRSHYMMCHNRHRARPQLAWAGDNVQMLDRLADGGICIFVSHGGVLG